MQNFNLTTQNYDHSEKIDEEMEETDSYSNSFRVDFSHYRIHPDQAGMSQTAEMEKILK